MTVTSMRRFKSNQALAEADKKAMAAIEHFEGMQRVQPFLFTFSTIELYKAQQALPPEVRKRLTPDYKIVKGEPLWGWIEDHTLPKEQWGTPVRVLPVSIIGCKVEGGVKDSMRRRNLVTEFLKKDLNSPSIKIAQTVLKELDKFCTVSADEEHGVITFVAKCKEWEDYIVLAVNMGLLNFMSELDALMKPYRT